MALCAIILNKLRFLCPQLNLILIPGHGPGSDSACPARRSLGTACHNSLPPPNRRLNSCQFGLSNSTLVVRSSSEMLRGPDQSILLPNLLLTTSPNLMPTYSPSPYDGDPNSCRAFLSHCSLVFALQPRRYATRTPGSHTS